MMPGMTYLPVPSMTFAPAGTATSVPTAAILPSRMTMVPFWMVPWLAVMMVALVMATRVAAGGASSFSTGMVGRRVVSAWAGRAPAGGVWAARTLAAKGSARKAVRIMASDPR